MNEDYKDVERLIQERLLRVNAAFTGVVTGLVAGIGLFLATNWLLLKGDSHPGAHLSLLAQYFIGYRVSFLGSLVGFAYAFALGFATAYVGARLYNWVAEMRHGTSSAAE